MVAGLLGELAQLAFWWLMMSEVSLFVLNKFSHAARRKTLVGRDLAVDHPVSFVRQKHAAPALVSEPRQLDVGCAAGGEPARPGRVLSVSLERHLVPQRFDFLGEGGQLSAKGLALSLEPLQAVPE